MASAQQQRHQGEKDADASDMLAEEQLPLRVHATATDKQRVSRQLLAFAVRSFGPRGRATLLQQSARCADALVLTGSAGRFLQHAAVSDCPTANVFVQMLRSHARRHSDAGLFLMILSATLQLEIQGGALAELPRSSVLRGLQLARQWSLAYLDDDSSPVRIPIDWSHRPSLHAFIRSVVGPKAAAAGLSEPVLSDAVIALVVETFVAVYAFVAQHPSESIPVRFVFLPGRAPSSCNRSQLWKHAVFLDAPWPRGSPSRPVTNATLALFIITIDPLRQEPPDGVSAAHASSQKPFRLEALRRVGDALHALGVTAVMSQKLIPRYLQMCLAAKGVFVLDRLSLSHIHAVRELSGASVLGDWSVAGVNPSAFGFLSLITTHEIGTKRYIRLHREYAEEAPPAGDATPAARRAAPICSVVLEAPDRLAFEELAYVVETALRRLAALAERPGAVAGAGCTEIHLAAFLRQKAELLRLPPTAAAVGSARTTRAQDSRALRQLRQAVEAVADCVLRVVTYLDSRGSGAEGEAMLEKLRDANAQTIEQASLSPPREGASGARRVELFGWSPSQRSVMPVVTYTASSSSDPTSERQVLHAHVLDSYASKRDALALAIDCACSIAGIASVMRVS